MSPVAAENCFDRHIAVPGACRSRGNYGTGGAGRRHDLRGRRGHRRKRWHLVDGCLYRPASRGTAAAAGDEVWVAKGVYTPTSSTDRTISFGMKSGVGIYGGFAGTETARDQRDRDANRTTLSGEVGAPRSSDNSYHVVSANNVDGTGVLDGFTITRGFANGAGKRHLRRRGCLSRPVSPSSATSWSSTTSPPPAEA